MTLPSMVETMSPGRSPAAAAVLPGSDVGEDSAPVSFEAESARHQRRDRLRIDADLSAVHSTRGSDLFENVLDDVAWCGETQALVPSRLREDQRVDPDHVPFGVHQGATAVTRIDRRVRLYVDHRVFRLELASDCADDSHRDRVFEPERATKREHDLTWPQSVGIAKVQVGQACLLKLQNRQVGLSIDAHDLRADEASARTENGARVVRLSRDQNAHATSSGHDVSIGHEVAVRAQNHSRAATSLFGDELARGHDALTNDITRSLNLNDGGVDAHRQLLEGVADGLEFHALLRRTDHSER